MRTQCWHTSFWQGQAPSGSTSSHWSMQGKYSGTVLAHKHLAGAEGLHKATRALREYSDTELTQNQSINHTGTATLGRGQVPSSNTRSPYSVHWEGLLGHNADTQAFSRVRLHQAAHPLFGRCGANIWTLAFGRGRASSCFIMHMFSLVDAGKIFVHCRTLSWHISF
jgi:hypothetical protein